MNAQWRELVADVNHIGAVTGWGMAGTWALIHAGDYQAAREHVDRMWAMYL